MDASNSSQVADSDTSSEAAFVDEYSWLRSFGMTDAAIARTLRVSGEGLAKRLQRAGVRRAGLSADADIDARLQVLIKSGEPFDSWDFSFAFDPFLVAAAISVAVRRGLVVRVGSRRPGSGRGGLFRSTAAARVVWEVA